MANDQVTPANLGKKMLSAAKTSFGAKFADVKQYVQAESEKLAITLRMIIAETANGGLSKAEAKILLNMQRNAMSAVLTATEGMTAVAVQSAINAALGAVKDFVNAKIGFALL